MTNTSLKRLLILFVFSLTQCFATTYFVRPGGSGNGTSWANAWGNVSSIGWSSLSPGDTVCVAGGSYSGTLSTGKSGTSSSPITVKRAAASDSTCGSGTSGWSASYDSHIAMSGTIGLANDYVTIDGATLNGITITLTNPNPGGSDGSGIWVGGPTSGVVLRNIEVAGPCPSGQTCAQNADNRSVNLNYWTGSSYALQNNMTLQYMNLHGACTILWSAHSNNLVIEHSRFADTSDTTPGNPYCHPNVIATQDTSLVFRYNEVTTWEVEGIMSCPSGACTFSAAIYGNVWHDPFPGYHRILEPQYNSNGPWLFYNNTIVNDDFECASNGANGGSFAPGSQGRNNLFIGDGFNKCGLPDDDYDAASGSTGETHGQNSVPTNIFANYSAKNIAGYHLSSGTTSGANLGTPYNIDYDGNGRTTWDRGAFEYNGSASGPSAPTGLMATVQ